MYATIDLRSRIRGEGDGDGGAQQRTSKGRGSGETGGDARRRAASPLIGHLRSHLPSPRERNALTVPLTCPEREPTGSLIGHTYSHLLFSPQNCVLTGASNCGPNSGPVRSHWAGPVVADAVAFAGLPALSHWDPCSDGWPRQRGYQRNVLIWEHEHEMACMMLSAHHASTSTIKGALG